MTPDERARRAIAVKALLADPDIQAALADIETDLTDEWKACFDERERQNLWLSVRLLAKLREWMLSAASHDLTALRRFK